MTRTPAFGIWCCSAMARIFWAAAVVMVSIGSSSRRPSAMGARVRQRSILGPDGSESRLARRAAPRPVPPARPPHRRPAPGRGPVALPALLPQEELARVVAGLDVAQVALEE